MLRKRFDSVAERQPQALAIVDGPTRLTYAELQARSNSLARYLVSELGLRRRDYLALCLSNCWEYIVGFLAALSVGAVSVPVSPQWRAGELSWLASRLPLRALLTNSQLFRDWRDADLAPPGIALVDEATVQRALLGAEPPLSSPPCRGGEAAVCYATSGSTGRPRLVLRSHSDLLTASVDPPPALVMRPGTRVLHLLPYYTTSGFSAALIRVPMNGAMSVVLRSSSPAVVEELVAQERVQVMVGSPFVYSMLLENRASRASFASVETAISVGAPIAPEIVRLAHERLGLRVRQVYGTTEAGVIAVQLPDVDYPPGVMGPLRPSIEIQFLDESGQPLAPGSTGEIAVRGQGVISGYLDEPELNQKLFRDGFFRTGDLGRLDESGNLVLCGRLKLILNLDGVKVDPVEIENVLMEIAAVRECQVRGVHDVRHGEIAAASLVVRPGCQLSRREVVAHCRARMAEFKIPRKIEFVDAITVDASGKRPQVWSAVPVPTRDA